MIFSNKLLIYLEREEQYIKLCNDKSYDSKLLDQLLDSMDPLWFALTTKEMEWVNTERTIS